MAGGFETVAFCEIEEWCHRTLNKHWPDVPIIEDVHSVTAGSVYDRTGRDRIDIITAGIPCQPASVAGKQLGSEDDRWLWPETIRVVADIKPRWILLENPDGIYSVGLSGILDELESIGYANGHRADGSPCIHPIEIPACAVGAPIIRNRVFIVACAAESRREAMQPESSQPAWDETRRQRFERLGSRCSSDMGSAGSAGLAGRPRVRGDDESQRQAAERANHWDNAQWLYCGFDGQYRRVPNSKPGFLSMAHGISGELDGLSIPLTRYVTPRSPESLEVKARLKAIGNSVNPQTIQQIGLAIMAAEEHFYDDAA